MVDWQQQNRIKPIGDEIRAGDYVTVPDIKEAARVQQILDAPDQDGDRVCILQNLCDERIGQFKLNELTRVIRDAPGCK